MDKEIASMDEAIADVSDGVSIALTGFGLSKGIAASLILATRDKGVRDLTVVCNSLGSDGQVRAHVLVQNGQVRRLVCSFSSRPGLRTIADDLIAKGELEVELVPQGVLVERLRAAGAGLAAIYSPTGADVPLATGKEVRYFDGRPYVLEPALPVDFAFARAWRADRAGNVQFRGSNIHFNLSMAKAAKTTIVEVDEVVEVGEIPPGSVGLQGIFVDRIVKSQVRVDPARGTVRLRRPSDTPRMYLDKPGWTRLEMARRVLQLVPAESYVNVGSGMPALIAKSIGGARVTLHGENGILGYAGVAEGPEADPDVFDAGGNDVFVRPGAAFFDSVTSFEIARSGRLDAVVLGAYQVDQHGDIANYSLGDPGQGGIGGAMDLIAGKSCLIAMMEHRDSKGRAKLVERCTLPLTATDCVDVVVSDLAVLRRRGGRFFVEEIAAGFTFEELQSLTELPLTPSGLAPETHEADDPPSGAAADAAVMRP